ncbi:Protein of unknown function [Colwellia chukchiensis]|uniref:DUF3108 domain-containing protein n=1 Tax=Colwellia chukchiensis TaxID=641665 RepID=A0A1H7M0U8_9GAMM|nr:DUF3108 domain-containing protein [Colwellia chukchiensis]SEL04217.1 Protein of unknown function [Colwellia chukchiensis]
MLKSLPYIALFLSCFTLANEVESGTARVMVPAFSAEYTILHKSKAVGTATRKLSYLDNGLAQYSYHTDIEWLIFSDTRDEISQLKIDGNKVTPMRYEYKREGTGSDKHYKWRYDIANNSAYNELKDRSKSIDFPVNIQDPLSYHLQHRLNMLTNPEQKHYVYPVVKTSGSIKNYVYQYDGEEELMLPYGLVKTIKLKREVIEKKRITYAWFAPELDYLLVKLQQIKGDVEQFEAQLKSVNGTSN